MLDFEARAADEILDYEARVEDERQMWEPLWLQEKADEDKAAARVKKKQTRWHRFPAACKAMSKPSGITLHQDGTKFYNEMALRRQADQEWIERHRYRLTSSIVVQEALRFIDELPSEQLLAMEMSDRLYSTLGDELIVNPRYTPDHPPDRFWSRFNVHSTGVLYLDTRLRLDRIKKFCTDADGRMNKKGDWIPECIKALVLFIKEVFLPEHHADVVRLQEEGICDIAQLAAKTAHMRTKADLVFRLLEPFRSEQHWTQGRVDTLWQHVFGYMIEPHVVPEYLASLLRRVQRRLLFLFLHYADCLFSWGAVPEHMQGEFVFYETDKSKSDGVSTPSTSKEYGDSDREAQSTVTPIYAECTVATRAVSCRLWSSEEFLQTMLTGIHTRARLGPLDLLDRCFTRQFDEALERSGEDDGEKPLPFVAVCAALLSAAKACTRTLSQQFMGQFREEDRLHNLLHDVKSIYTGEALCAYASALRICGASRPFEVREAFRRSLQSAGVARDRMKWWGVATDDQYGSVIARIPWPLEYIVHPPLLCLLADARLLLLSVMRCKDVLLDVQCDTEHPVPSDCVRPFCLLLCELLHVVTAINELFFRQAQSLVEAAFAKIDAASTVDEARGHADQLHDRLRDLVGSHGIRKMVRELVDLLCKMAEDMQLDLVCERVTAAKVEDWTAAVGKERQLLVSLGENMTNNVLADLATMLRVRPDKESTALF